MLLLYERPYTKVFFRKVAEGLTVRENTCTISEYKNCSDIWTSQYLYDKSLDLVSVCAPGVCDDIIRRCRTLRIMDQSRARRIVQRTWAGITKLFEQNDINLVVTLSLDNYVIDIIMRVAELKNCPVYSFLGSFHPGYARFTLRGEYNRLRSECGTDEVESLAQHLTDNNFLPELEAKSIKSNLLEVLKFYYRRAAIERLYYPMMKALTKDPDNARFNMLNLKGHAITDYIKPGWEKRFEHFSDISIDKAATVYMPLHFCPEATTDYYTDRSPKLGYMNYIVDVVTKSDPDILFLLKEHPSMYGKRLLKDYDRLQQLPNVRLLHPFDNSNEILRNVDTVAVDNGTVGVEAVARGKRVISLDRNYYSHIHKNIKMSEYISIEQLTEPLQDVDVYQIAEQLLQGWIRSDYVHTRYQDKYDPAPIVATIKQLINEGVCLGNDESQE